MTEHSASERSRDRYPRATTDLHGAIAPADIRKDERVAARLTAGNKTTDCRVWRLSPFGIEILADSVTEIKKSDLVTIELTIEGRTSKFDGVVVDTTAPNDDSQATLCGIRFMHSDSHNEAPHEEPDRRLFQRWLCSEEFFPTCVTPTPGRINDYIYFRIHDISAKGMRMKCSLRNKHLLPDMRLELFAQFPGAESAQIDVVIKRIRIEEEAGKDILSLGVEFENLDDHARTCIGQYLTQFSTDRSPKDIVDSGFKIESIALGTEFYFLKSNEDYQKVLELRRIAHKHAGNVRDEAVPEEMGDINDARSRIIVGKIGEQVVATARLRYNEIDAPLEHEAHMDLPADFPRRDQIVEISRAATHPDYRQSDLFVALWIHMSTYGLQKQRPYVLIGSHPALVKFYQKCGFKSTGHSHGEEMWTVKQHVMICNFHEAVMGKNTHPLYWNQMYRPIVKGAIEAGILSPNEMDLIRMSAFRKLAWLSKLKFRRPRKN